MKATELRIGNILQTKKGKLKTITAKDIELYAKIDAGDEYEQLLFPIELTDNLLLKFGFKSKAVNSVIPPYFKKGKIDVLRSEKGFYHINCGIIQVKLKYAHRLQNIHFELTEKELTIE